MHQKERGTLFYPPSLCNPEDWLRFVETKVFSSKWKALELDDETLRKLQIAIMLGPDRYPVMAGTGGLRKIRIRDEKTNNGKSSGFRVCYVFFSDYSIAFLVTLFGKNEKSNLSAAEKKIVAALIEDIRGQLDTGSIQ